ncbi:unnamed protein product [Orchesella dallaii]|uniref:Uncharacterized protein n=1 Tax=Orchesella dallaii TaxID=48710 RepID=A0ABP1QPR6_9HEXA
MVNKLSSSVSSRGSKGSGVSLRSTPAAKQRRNQRRKAKQQLKEEKPKIVKPPYKFVDATVDLGEEPETLEIHPTKSAPTVSEIEDELAREDEKEKLRFFNVPIKIYDPSKEVERGSAQVETLQRERNELNRYGSRVVMNTEGHVIGMEVRHDLIRETRRKNITTEICQCIEREYEVGEELKTNRQIRRKFMAYVLLVEAAFRFPSILFYIIQYNYMLLTLLTAVMQSFQMHFIQYEEFEDPTSLTTVNIKKKTTPFSYPYCFCLGTAYQLYVNCIVGSILLFSKKRMAEFGNTFLGVIVVITIVWIVMCLLVVEFAHKPFGIRKPTSWDMIQVVASSVCVCKWSMWRFFMLQELLRGKVMEVRQGYHHVVALSFAI